MNFFERNGTIVGFRPEHLLPEGTHPSTDNLVNLWFTVTRVEDLGAGRLLYGNEEVVKRFLDAVRL